MASEYCELHCHSYFSLLDGASSPEALVDKAAALGYRALALTDHDGLYGAVRFWQAAQGRGIRAIIGAEVSLEDGHHLTLLAETQQGYANLSRLLSLGQLAGQKKLPRLTLDTLARHTEGLLCLSGCCHGAVASALSVEDEAAARSAAACLYDIFGPDRFRIELQRQFLPADGRLTADLIGLARHLAVGSVATNNTHYATRSGQRLHDVLTCIRQHASLPEALAGGHLHPNSERMLKSAEEMARLFSDVPDAVRETVGIAERCQVSLDFSTQRLPAFPVPPGHTPLSYLRELCEEGLRRRFDPVAKAAQTQLEHELGVIERTGLAGYFLVVWDIVRFARAQGIRCQGRGSAANSLAAYVLGITPVDPLRHRLLFERFLSEGSHTMPDIDVDFCEDRREEVIQYVYERYGEEHVAMVCNVVTFRARSAVRDVAKALAFPPDVIDQTAKALDTRSATKAAEEVVPAEELEQSLCLPPQGADPNLPWHMLSELLREIDGAPRHLSIHVGGMLITASPLIEVVPVERATMPGRVVVQWDKDSVEDAGLIKIDLLSLRTLGMIEEILNHIRTQRGIDLDLDRLPLDDPTIFDMLQRADTLGCFQVESRAQSQMLPKMKPQRFEDIIIEVAIVRPGPIQGNMVHPYLRRRQGLEEVSYAHPSLRPALEETLGVIIFQEQVLRVAMAVAGFSPAEADRLRRAISRSRSTEALAALRERFLSGAQANGVEAETAEEVFRQLACFAGFGFCKSHAAAFALVAYQTLYLKARYPAEFFCALLNHQPMGFYSPEVLIGDAERHGVPVLRPDLNLSQAACTLVRAALSGKSPTLCAVAPTPLPHPHPPTQWAGEESARLDGSMPGSGTGASPLLRESEGGPAMASRSASGNLGIRLGLSYVHGLGEAGQERLLQRRAEGSYQGLPDLCKRALLPRVVVENLIRAGALDGFGQKRRDLLWALGGLDYREEELEIEVPVDKVALPALSQRERMGWEYELLGLSPGDHVMRLYRQKLHAEGVLNSAEVWKRRDGETVRVAGLVAVRQKPPTAKGHVFITLEDEEGLVNLIVRPGVYERYRAALRNASLLWASGRLQREGQALSVLVHMAEDLTAR